MSQNKMFKRPDTERRWIENWVFVKDPGDDTPPDPPDDPPDDPPEDPPTDEEPLVGIYITIPVMDGVIPTDLNYGVIPEGYIPKSIYVPNPTLQDPFGGYWLHWWQPNYVIGLYHRIDFRCELWNNDTPAIGMTTHFGIVPTGFYRILRLIPAEGQRPSYYLEWYQPNLLDNPNIGRA